MVLSRVVSCIVNMSKVYYRGIDCKTLSLFETPLENPVFKNYITIAIRNFWGTKNPFHPLILGDPETALAEPNNIAISERLVEKYFGEDWRSTAMGRSLW